MKHSVLLDTSFFIRLLNDGDSLHKNALGYFKYFLEKEIVHKVSTISVAEYSNHFPFSVSRDCFGFLHLHSYNL